MYDISKLKTVEECRTVMDRAKARKLDDVYRAVFRRYCELVGKEYEDPSDPLIADFYETLAAYEQLLTEKNGFNTRASRTRQKIDNKGVHRSLVEWTCGKAETNGFDLLVGASLARYTGEFLVVKYANRFPEEVVALARERLRKHQIESPS